LVAAERFHALSKWSLVRAEVARSEGLEPPTF
jgi:hypothetical protein